MPTGKINESRVHWMEGKEKFRLLCLGNLIAATDSTSLVCLRNRLVIDILFSLHRLTFSSELFRQFLSMSARQNSNFHGDSRQRRRLLTRQSFGEFMHEFDGEGWTYDSNRNSPWCQGHCIWPPLTISSFSSQLSYPSNRPAFPAEPATRKEEASGSRVWVKRSGACG